MTKTAHARVTRNIDLAFQFLNEVIDAPARADEVPSGASIFVMPAADPEFNREQMELARIAATAGRETFLWRLGVPPEERAAFRVSSLTPRWPQVGIDPVAFYDRDEDILIVDFFNDRRRGTVTIGTGEFGELHVDAATGEIIAQVLPHFLAAAVPREPSVIDILLRPETELRGVTRTEVVEIKRALLADHWQPEAPIASFAAMTDPLARLAG